MEEEVKKSFNLSDNYKNLVDAYSYILKDSFGLNNEDINVFNTALSKLFDTYFVRLDQINNSTKYDLLKSQDRTELREGLKEAFRTTFISNYNRLLLKSNSSEKSCGIIFQDNKLADFYSLLCEYPKFYLKNNIINGNELDHYSQEFAKSNFKELRFEEIDSLFLTDLKPKTYTDVFDITLNSLGLVNLNMLREFNVSLMNHISKSDLDFNFEMNNDYYYDKEKNLSYIKENDTYFIVSGKFKSKEDLFANRIDLSKALLDNNYASKCIAQNPNTKYNEYLAPNGYYYYRIRRNNQTKYYKSKTLFHQVDLDSFNNRVQQKLEEVKPLDNLGLNDIYVLENKNFTRADLENIANVSKLNIDKILKNYNRNNNSALNKTQTLAILKESFKAYKNALNKKKESLNVFRVFSKLHIIYQLYKIKKDILNTLNISRLDFEESLSETAQNKTITNVVKKYQNDLLETKDDLTLEYYLSQDLENKVNLKNIDKEFLKEEVTGNLSIKHRLELANNSENLENILVELTAKDDYAFDNEKNKELNIIDDPYSKEYLEMHVDEDKLYEIEKKYKDRLNTFEKYYVLYSLEKAKKENIELSMDDAVLVSLTLNDKINGSNNNLELNKKLQNFTNNIAQDIFENIKSETKNIEVDALKNDIINNSDNLSYKDFEDGLKDEKGKDTSFDSLDLN